MEIPPPEKRLKMAPFTIHATRGLLRDPKMRRIMMAISIALAAILLVIGLTGLRSWLAPHEHPWRFILFWISCGWITVTALLLALFDLLLTRAQDRAAQKALREQLGETRFTPPNNGEKE
jgi:formate-dependent nitrite reductase membrane component NrfD